MRHFRYKPLVSLRYCGIVEGGFAFTLAEKQLLICVSLILSTPLSMTSLLFRLPDENVRSAATPNSINTISSIFLSEIYQYKLSMMFFIRFALYFGFCCLYNYVFWFQYAAHAEPKITKNETKNEKRKRSAVFAQ